MGRMLELKAWADDTEAANINGLKPPNGVLERMVVGYYRSNVLQRVLNTLSPSPAYRVKKYIESFNKKNRTDFKRLSDVKILDLKIKKFEKTEKEFDFKEPSGLPSVYPEHIRQFPEAIQKKLIPKNNPSEPGACYLPPEMMYTDIATFHGEIKLLSPLFGDSAKEYNIRIEVVKYYLPGEDGPLDIQIYIYDKGTMPVTDYIYGADLTSDTKNLADRLGLFYNPNGDMIDTLLEVPQSERKRGIFEGVYIAMHQLRENVEKAVAEFLESYVISPDVVLTLLDKANVNMTFVKPPKDSRSAIAMQIHEGEVDASYFYLGDGAEIYRQACGSDQYIYSAEEEKLLEEHGKDIVGKMSPGLVIALGCGSGEKEHLLFEKVDVSPKFVAIDSSPAMLALFIDTLKSVNPEITLIHDDITDVELPEADAEKILYTFLGNTLGNFSLVDQLRILAKINKHAKPGDILLIGLNKFNPEADNCNFEYDESATQFVTGVLSKVDLEGKTTQIKQFDIEQRTHYILVTFVQDCEVLIDGIKHRFKKGEQAKLIQSKRYTREEIEELMQAGGFENYEIFENEYTFLIKAVK